MWTGLLIWKADNDTPKGTYFSSTERLAWSAPPGDAEAYGCNLEEDKGDSDIMSELDEQEINLEVLGEQLIHELEDNEDDRFDKNEDNMYD